MRKVMIIVSLVLIMLGLGCAAMSHYVTYAEIDPDAVGYVVNAGVADVNDYDSWWPNLVLVERLDKDIDGGHKLIQLSLKQLIQKDDLEYSIHKDTVSHDLAIASERENLLFGETGLLSLGLSMAGFGGLTGILGLMRKRPGDITVPEMEQTLALATGKTIADLSTKDRQFVQLVKGLQVFRDKYRNSKLIPQTNMLAELTIAMNAAQDTDTQAAVAVVKKYS